MTNGTKLILAAGLMCGTAAPVALAQEADQNAAVQACQRLTLIVRDYEDRFRDQWIDRANDVIGRAGRVECAQYVAQAERAIEELERRDRAAAQGQGQQNMQNAQNRMQQSGEGAEAQAEADVDGGRIIVSQPEPRVLVEQNAPEITYSQDEAQVRVQQGTPQIIVRQAEPTVRVQIPRPQITIDQPQPEIIVRIPEPDVAVDVPEPQFEVSQTQPEVRVRQPEPQVRVQMEQPEVDVEEQDQAQVQLQRDQAVVRREGGEQQANVQVERARPQVRYEQAEPNVEFEMEGEPQVTYNRTGEPNVRVERMGDQSGQQAMQNRQGMQDEERTASIQQDQMSEQAVQALRGDGRMQGSATVIRVSELVDREIVNTRGEELGEVERVVSNGNRTYLILSEGGFLGMGEREVALPLDRVSSVRGDDELVLQGLSEDDIEAMPRWNSDNADELGDNDEVEIFES